MTNIDAQALQLVTQKLETAITLLNEANALIEGTARLTIRNYGDDSSISGDKGVVLAFLTYAQHNKLPPTNK
jgi:hypothetical protein